MRRTHPDDSWGALYTDSDAYLEGSKTGPLVGLSFAAKDIFDVAGHVTGGGNPDWRATHEAAERTAWAVQVLVGSGATMVGTTVTDELTRGILGDNAHYGMPVNPRAPGRVPGGSSSGSAAAVAGGLVEFALGSDTGGSVRAPASFCGLYGVRPTHGRISLAGVMPNAPTFDTVGWLARDAETLARVGEVLLGREIPAARPHRLVIAEDGFAQADDRVRDALQPAVERVAAVIGESSRGRLAPVPLDDLPEPFAVLQGSEAWHSYADWIDAVNPRMSFEVAARFALGREVTDHQRAAAQQIRDRVTAHLTELLAGDTVVCLPTMPFVAPVRGLPVAQRRVLHRRIDALVDTAGLAGTPQISLPLAELDGLPVGLSLIGARGSDELLLGLAREVARTVGP